MTVEASNVVSRVTRQPSLVAIGQRDLQKWPKIDLLHGRAVSLDKVMLQDGLITALLLPWRG